jgi:amino acid adenylation domain-containing protein
VLELIPLPAAEGAGDEVFVLPASFAQRRLWFLERLEPGSPLYNIPAALHLKGELAQGALARALGEIVRRHEPLRTALEADGEEPVQVVAPYRDRGLPFIDLSDLGSAAAHEAARELAEEEAARPFDLARGPLFRCLLARLAEREHLLLVTFHHAAADGWSLGVFYRELAALYGAFRRGLPSPLPELPIQYADFAVWQRQRLDSGVRERQLAYWREQLGDAPRLAELPLARPRPAVRSHRGIQAARTLPGGLARAAAELARREGVTPFMVFLAAWKALLFRTTWRQDLVVGTPVAGRSPEEAEGLIGLFVNTLALRTRVDGRRGFRDLLARVRDTSLAAFAHQDLPFEQLVEELAPERSLAHDPLVQVIFGLQDTATQAAGLPGLAVRAFPVGHGTAKFDLGLSLAEEAGELVAHLDARADLYAGVDLERLLAAFESLLAAAVAEPDRRLDELPLLTAAERRQVLVEWNAAAAPLPEAPAIRAFEAWARRTPAAPAVVAEEGALTYGELDAWADRLAAGLRRLGIGPEARVAVAMEHSAARIAALLATHKAGAAYVSLDPADPPERLALLLADCGARVALGDLGAVRGLESAGREAAAAPPPAPGIGPEHLAYVIYTSGSTGVPKGVEVPQRGLSSLVAWHLAAYGLRPGDRTTQLAGVGFDASVWELWPTLAAGATLVVPPIELRADPPRLVPWLVEQGITVCFLPTPVAELALAEPWPREAPLRALLTGGDRLRRAPRPGLPFRLVNHYGPTENSVVATAGEVAPGAPGAPPIGRPIANTRAYVLDAAGQPLPVGFPGELYLGGESLARGYLARPDLTAERFLPDPFGAAAGGRLYRTGDLVRWRPDGELDFLGRADLQVKVRGVRIELGEVEAALAGHPAVREAVVAAREERGDGRLVAYVAPADAAAAFGAEAEALVETLRRHLERRLPAALVPAAWVVLPALPLTSRGKVDRGALPAPEAPAGDEPRAGGGDAAEELLAAIWADVLGVPRVGPHDHFFALGGHSLLAVRVAARVRELFGIELPLRALFEEPTVAGLARRIAALAAGEGAAAAPPLRPEPRRGHPPASFAQERLWFLDRLGETGDWARAAYNVPLALEIEGPLEPAALAAALAGVVARHEVLRATFAAENGRLVQVVAPRRDAPLPLMDLSGLAAADREAEARRLAAAEARRPFDLARGPLLRCALLRLDAAAPESGGHLLLATFHHAVSDGWSMGVFLREAAALYGAAVLPPLPLQYADYAVWQRRWLDGPQLAVQLAHWRQRLAGLPEALELPADRPRPAAFDARGGRLRRRLPAGLLADLEALGRRQGTTLFMTLMAGFQALLARWSGSEDFAVGAPVAGRNRVELEGLIGLFVNTLVLRADLAGDPAGTALLARVRESALAAWAHQDLPFEKLVEELAPRRHLARSPLFQVLLVLQNAPYEPPRLPGLAVRPLAPRDGEETAVKFDLALAFAQSGDELALEVEYSRDLFDRATAARLAEHLATLLAGLAAAPERRVWELPLLTSEERRQVVVEWNATTVPLPAAPTIPALFARQARDRAAAPALVWDGGSLSYGELDARSNRLARRLARLGVGPESLVGVALERSPELIVALLAILKAGGAYLPLDPEYPRQRLALMLDDALAEQERVVVVTRGSLAAGLPELPPSCALLDLDREDLSGESAAPLALPLTGEHLAYVLYTSGSTGTPKGVAVPHRSVVRLVHGADFAALGADEVFLQMAPVPFDASTLEIWGPLLNGGRLALLAPGPASLEELGASIARHGVTTLWLTAGLFHQMVERQLPALLGVRQLLAGGDVLSPAHVARVLGAAGGGGRVLINGYGPTENTTFTCCHRMAAGTAVGTSVPIGRPIANTRVYLLDREMQPVPVGVPGELYAGGIGLARGYLHRPELTAERFVPDPFGAGGRLYRTGDLARWRPDGAVEFLGRLDGQVKLRGFRVEIGEVEAVLAAHPAVAQAAVAVRAGAGGDGDKRLVAYVVPAAGAEGPELAAALRRDLARQLPDYMVPSAWVVLAELPLGPTGKVDRAALPEPEPAAGEGVAGAAPRTPLEELLAQTWEELLGRERVAREDSFFELGGHSLLATRVVSRLRELLGVELPLRALFEEPTVAGLAARVEALRAAGEVPAAPPLLPRPRDARPPASFAQERLWLLDRIEGQGAVYNVPLALEMTGPLAAPALAAALSALAGRHEALRTTFAEEGGRAVQVVVPEPPVTLPVADLSELGARADGEARRLLAAEAARPFDLARGPLLRALLLRLDGAAERHLLLLALHHVACDGWSLGVLLAELAALYAAALEGRAAALPPLPIQYADFAAWQRDWLQGEALEAQLRFWRAALADVPPVLELPTDRPRPAVRAFRGGRRLAPLPPAAAAAAAALGRRHGTTLFMTLLAAFQALLARTTGSERPVVGSPVAGRTRAATEGLIGCFVNTLVHAGNLGGDPAVEVLLARTRAATLDAFAHQDLPFEKLVEELQPRRDLVHPPLFQVMLVLQNAPAPPPRWPGLAAKPVPAAHASAKFDLTLGFAPAGGAAGDLLLEIEHDRDLFDPSTAERLAQRFAVLLAGMAAEPAARLSELPLLTPAERAQTLVEWNDTGSALALSAAPALLHRLCAAQAERTPDAPAVLYATADGETVELTHRELQRRARRLARRLRALGVGPEVRVGVALERTPELPVALLAVLEAGGAYVPLDPAYPAERLSAMVEDARAGQESFVLLTQERLAPRLAALAAGEGPPVRLLDVESAEGDAGDDEGPLPVAVDPDNLAYLIYTSGSTGRPKGVAITHRSAAALVAWARTLFAPEDLAGAFASTSINFDLSVFELFVPLAAGGTVVLGDDALALAGSPLAARVTLVNTVPSAMAELARLGAVPPTVRTVNLAGEPLRGALARRLYELPHVERVLNLYGPSEDTTYSTVALAPRRGEPTIGVPITGTRAYVLDRWGVPAPVGVPGELWLGGEGLARGYLHRPDLTAERWVPDPFSGAAGARLYRTGDLARWLPAGELEFLGRIDHQVKVRGFRIELGEIETLLLAHPGVREAVALAREAPPAAGALAGEKRLVAYVAPAEGAPDDLADRLAAHLAARLPGYMLPALVVLPELPRTPNGKVDRKALPEPDLAGAAGYVPPREGMEELLAGLWAELLGVPRVGARDDFFALGGHSLLAARLASRLRETLGVELPLRRIFELPALADLAREVEAARRGAAAAVAEGPAAAAPPPLPRPRPSEVPAAQPLSWAQERLYFLDQFEPGSAAYNIPAVVRLAGPLRPELLAEAFAAVERRHEVLRTTFTTAVGGEPVQVVAPAGPARPMPLVDLSALADAAETEASRLAAGEALRPFDLARGPLVRLALLRLPAEPATAGRHLLLLTQHHIVTDGWSLSILVRELAGFYAAFAAGEAPALPPPPLQYADFAVWQREALAGSEQVSYWRTRLAGAPPLLELPADRPRPATPDHRGDWRSVTLEPQLVAALRVLARAHGASLFMTLAAAFQLQLGRLAGVEDVSVGLPAAGRRTVELERVLGFFVNTLVLRTDLSGAPTFGELLARVRDGALDAYAHQDVPFEKVLDELQPPREPGRTPLFQVFLNYLNQPPAAARAGELVMEAVGSTAVVAKFDLSLYVVDEPGESGGLRLDWVYAAELFDGARIEEMARQLAHLLRQAAAQPDAAIGTLSLLTPEAGRFLADPESALERPPQVPVPERVAAWARETPDAPALRQGERRWSYAELWAAAEGVARALVARGLEPGATVAVAGTRSFGLVAAMLGTWAARGVLLTLDPALPAGRRRLMLEESRARFLLAVGAEGAACAAEAAIEGGEIEVLRLDRDGGGLPAAAAKAALPKVADADPAYVFFTSGSTGLPKAVLGQHAGLAHFLAWQSATFAVGPGDHCAQLTALSFDVVLRDVFVGLVSGAALHLPPEEVDLGADSLLPWLEEERITLLHTVPTLARDWLAIPAAGPGVGLARLRCVFFAGEPLSDTLVARWRERFPEQAARGALVNLYGPTETTLAKFFHVAASPPDPGVQPVGVPLPQTQGLVLGPAGRCGVGEPGEIAIRTPFRSLGYLNQPAETARRFLPNPFRPLDPEDAIYRTGDRGRWRPDGRLEILGRLDRQVKVRGVRVEPGEVEAVLERHPRVRQAAVVAQAAEGGDVELLAYVVPGGVPAAAVGRREDLRAWLAGQLPEALVPAAVVELPALPRLPSGKVDRSALPAPPPPAAEEAVAAPGTELEERVAAIWREVLGRERAGPDSHFFALGGNSLLALRVVARVRAALAVELPVRALFDAPVLADFAARVEGALPKEAPAPEPAAEARELRAPLSFAQARLWFLEQLTPGIVAYHLPLAFRLAGPFGPRQHAALAAALALVVRRHAALRTVFALENGEPVQVVAAPAAVPLPVVDLAALPPARLDAEAARLRAADAALPFDLARGPLFRPGLLRLAAAEHQLLLTAHHIVSDAWSSALLMRELVAGYRAALAGAPPDRREVPPLPMQYADHARRQRARLQGEALAEQVAYWRGALAGAPELLELPTDLPRPALQSFRGLRRRFALPRALTAELRALSGRGGASLFMTLLAGLQTLLGRYAGSADVSVGTAVSGRERLESENLIGFFVNTLVLRGDLRGDPTFAELVARLREVCLEAFAHQEVPFEKLVEELQPRRNLAHSPLFQVMFALPNVPRTAPALPGLDLAPLASNVGAAKFDLTFQLLESGDELVGQVDYDRDLFHATTVERLIAHFGNLLAAAAADPARRLSELPLLDRRERHHLLAEWNDTAAPYPRHLCLHQLFEARAAEMPEAVAVVAAGGASLSYGELNRRANRLAHRLRALGVGPGSLVGVHLERSPAMVVAILAVHKAGGAYVPLEVSWPAQRVHGILERHRLVHLLTETSRRAALAEQAPPPRHTLCLDEAEPDGLPEHDPAPAAGPEDTAYIIFTSGSTGLPKGVVVRHRPAVNLAHWVNKTFGVGPADRLLFITALSFDLSVYDIFGILAAGGSIRLASSDEVHDAEALVHILVREPITFWDSAPAALQQCASYFPQHASSAALRLVFLSGDWIPVSLPDRVRSAFPKAHVIGLGGATEATVWSNVYPIGDVDPAWKSIPYGRPIENARYHVLDRRLEPCPIGVAGDLYIGGECLSDGYADEPELTARKYVPDPFSGVPGARLYQTGDRARAFADGNLEFLGRSDTQVKVRGYRIELGEIEAALAAHPAVREAVVLVREDAADPARVEAVRDQRLVAYLIPRDGEEADAAELRRHLRARLPEYMVPAAFVWRQSWPLSPTGKLDRKALPPPERAAGPEPDAPARPAAAAAVAAPAPAGREELEAAIAAVWREVIGTETVGRSDNFFDLGGHSLLMARVQARLQERLERSVPLVELFRHPTVAALAEHLLPDVAPAPALVPAPAVRERRSSAVAVVGMAGRFPGAPDLDAFWANLRDGVESIRFFTDEELLAAGLDPAALADPRLVKARGAIDGPELFDAGLFDVPPREAQLLDPQQRFFLEACWQALEDAGYGGAAHRGRVGVWAGVSESTYLHDLMRDPELVATVGALQLMVANGSDYAPSRVSYKLDLRGPSVNVQTACSTSLVAVHSACLALLHGDCDLALAGGASVRSKEIWPYRYQEGGTHSPDGHIRAFDAEAGGMINGSGVGVVVLKRLEDALADGDRVRAVVLGSASTNDGAAKVGFTAPGVEGQAAAIRGAQAAAGVHPDSIRYVEAHGTGTPVGDPIEIAALTQAFRGGTDRRGFCAVGTVKPNIGHLDTAAGVAGLIKTVLALEHRQIPPSINYRAPNPQIDFAASPFYVADRLEPWESDGRPRRAGVSSFGIGGTNAHVVLEEGPQPEPSGPPRPAQLLLLSAKTPTALAAAAARLADHLEARPEWGAAGLADAAFTLRLGRAELRHRRAVVCRGRAEAVAALRGADPARSFTRAAAAGPTSTLFLFPGQGAQHVGMGTELYAEEPVFRAALDACAEGLAAELGYDLRGLLYPPAGADLEEAAGRLRRTEAAQPALFAVEYALAMLWRAWGIEPRGMLGHSIGELVAACLAGVFTLPEALRLVALRGRLMGELPAGVMLAVPLPEAEVAALLAEHGDLALAAVNAPASCVVSGPEEGIARLEERLAAVETRRLHTSHAFHSAMMDPALEPFAAAVRAAGPRPPAVPFVSNLTGTWITAGEATDPAYWARQLRHTVRFADGLATLLATPGRALLEVGPGRTLVTLAHQHPDKRNAEVVAGSLGRARDAGSDLESVLAALGRLWTAGVPVDHAAFFAHERRRRVPLPTYPFERKRYWIDVQPAASATRARVDEAAEPPPFDAGEEAGGGAEAPAGEVAPRNELETEIAAAFRAQLGVERLGVHDDFFEIGGSSLMAVQLGARLRERLGVELPSNFLLESSTVAALAERVARERGAAGEERPAPPPSCLVALQTGGNRRPLFLVHQVGGNVYTFRALARELGRDQPVYGLRSLGLEGDEQPLATVPAMAAHYLELMRGAQPRGPYLLGGASMGGMVAYEMAQRLIAAGEEVALLTLMDTPRMDHIPERPQSYGEFLGALLQGSVPLTREELAGLEPEEQLALVVGKMNEPDPELTKRLLRVRLANTIALFDYTPQPYPGSLLFFRATERRPVDDPHPELHWPPLARDGVEVLFVPGTHESMHEPPNVRAIAERLRRRLREAVR